MTLLRVVVVIMLTSLLSLSCLHQKAAVSISEADAKAKPADVSQFAYEPDKAEAIVNKGPGEFEGIAVTSLSIPGYFEPEDPDRAINAHFYQQPEYGRHKTILVLPILGGDFEVSREFAKFLYHEGYNVLRYERKKAFLRPGSEPKEQREVLRESVIDMRRGIDWLLAQDNVDPERLGVIGISLGGVHAAILLGTETRLAGGAILISGCDLAERLAKVKEIEVVEFRDAILEKEGISREDFRQLATKAMADIDPSTVAANINPARTLMVNGIFDRVMPYRNGEKLYQLAGKPNRFLIPTGHYSSVVYLAMIKIELLRHFEKVFAAGLSTSAR